MGQTASSEGTESVHLGRRIQVTLSWAGRMEGGTSD